MFVIKDEGQNLLVIGAPEHDADAYHLSGFLAPELKSGARAYAVAVANLLDELGASNSPVVVPADFGIVYADELRARGITLTPDGNLFDSLRRAKTEEEVSNIEKTQDAVEAACAHCVSILEEAEIGEDEVLNWRGETLTNERLQKMYDAVLESQETALSMIRAGVNGKDIHRKVADVLHEAGYKTNVHDQEEGKPLTEGFFHGTGHGVGLEIHESPSVSLADEALIPGDVISVEPGVYDPKVGGVRIEDLVVVTEESCRNLTKFPKEFRIKP